VNLGGRLKTIDSLQIQDLEAHAVWHYHGSNSEGEPLVRPVKSLPVSNLQNEIGLFHRSISCAQLDGGCSFRVAWNTHAAPMCGGSADEFDKPDALPILQIQCITCGSSELRSPSLIKQVQGRFSDNP
jgi:hypothetical protein